MRLGGLLFESYSDPDGWITALKHANYSAAYCPQIPAGISVGEFERAAQDANIVIAEVGAWRNNPMSTDDAVRREAIWNIQEKLALADEIGANCCVNVAGSRGDAWAGPDARDLTEETFDLLVETVREIIDGVKPKRTFYSLETMQWMYPESTESYARLLRAIERPAFGVHFDPVNLLYSPPLAFRNAGVVGEFVSVLGAHIKSVHIKDVALRPEGLVHLDEVRPGTGMVDYRTLLKALDELGLDLPLMLEHMSDPQDYVLAAGFVRETARELGVVIE